MLISVFFVQETHVFIPLLNGPVDAHSFGYESSTVWINRIRDHFSNLEVAHYNEIPWGILNTVTITPMYSFADPRCPEHVISEAKDRGYPDISLSTFTGIVKFICESREGWDILCEFMFHSNTIWPETVDSEFHRVFSRDDVHVSV